MMTKLWNDSLDYLDSNKSVAKAVAVAVGTVIALRYVHSWWQYYLLYKLRNEKRKLCRQSLCKLDQSLRGASTIRKGNLIHLSFAELAAHLQDGSLNATQVLEAYQIQALAVHKTTNCLIEPILEAESLALQCDSKRSMKGPLHGIPVSLKDNIGLEGYDSTAGCSNWINHPFPEDAVIVKVLKKQGAIPFVKTNVPQTMVSYETTNPIFGATTHGLDKKRGVGGSSGGEGALLAGKGSILGFGSDIGGSIRIPSHMNGVYGLKPTSKRISPKGTFPLYKGQTSVPSSYGPMARDVDTLVAAMKALCVPYMYMLDPTIPYQPFREELYQTKKKLKIGYYLNDNFIKSIPAVQRGVLVAKGALEKMGHQVIPWEYPDLGYTAALLYGDGMFGDGGKELQTLLKHDAVDSAVSNITYLWLIPGFMRRLLYYVIHLVMPYEALFIQKSTGLGSVSDWWKHIAKVEAFRAAVIADWTKNGLDAVIAPGFACCALPFGQAAKATGATSYTFLYNVLNFPAGSQPVSKVTSADCEALHNYPTPSLWGYVIKKGMIGTEGLPINVQVAALPWQEETCLRVMKDLETGLTL